VNAANCRIEAQSSTTNIRAISNLLLIRSKSSLDDNFNKGSALSTGRLKEFVIRESASRQKLVGFSIIPLSFSGKDNNLPRLRLLILDWATDTVRMFANCQFSRYHFSKMQTGAQKE
jgi:hypothetical protein